MLGCWANWCWVPVSCGPKWKNSGRFYRVPGTGTGSGTGTGTGSGTGTGTGSGTGSGWKKIW